MSKPEITYPCTWSYTIIVSDVESVLRWIDASLYERERTLSESNRSRSGKYVSLQLSVRVESQERRDEIFRGLQSQAEVKLVL